MSYLIRLIIYKCQFKVNVSHVAQQARSHSYAARQNSTLRNFVLLWLVITKLGMVDCISNSNFRWVWL